MNVRQFSARIKHQELYKTLDVFPRYLIQCIKQLAEKAFFLEFFSLKINKKGLKKRHFFFLVNLLLHTPHSFLSPPPLFHSSLMALQFMQCNFFVIPSRGSLN